jgi:hypothetical protein
MPESPSIMPPLLVPESEARRLLGGLCAKTMYLMRRRGLPHLKIGTRVMYRPADLEMWIERKRGEQTSDP